MSVTVEDISKKLIKLKEANREAAEKKASLEGRRDSIKDALKEEYGLAPEDVESEIDSLQDEMEELDDQIKKEFEKLTGEGK